MLRSEFGLCLFPCCYNQAMHHSSIATNFFKNKKKVQLEYFCKYLVFPLIHFRYILKATRKMNLEGNASYRMFNYGQIINCFRNCIVVHLHCVEQMFVLLVSFVFTDKNIQFIYQLSLNLQYKKNE